MRRRELIIFAGSLACWPLLARAQGQKVPKIGVLVAGTPDPRPFWRVFRQALRDLGYIERQNIQFEYRSADGDRNRLKDLATALVHDNVDIIVAWQTPTVTAAQQATHSIPIVMASAGDPVGTGLIASLARPGGNVTGMAGITAELAGKSVDLIREMFPSARQVAALCNGPDPFSKPFLAHIQLGGKATGLAVKPVILTSNDQLDGAFSSMNGEHVDAVIIQPSLPTRRTALLALQHHLPAISASISFADEGGLLSYSASQDALYRESASYVDKILKGAKPADLPVEQPTKFELVLNRRTAKALGVQFPPRLVAIADEVIE